MGFMVNKGFIYRYGVFNIFCMFKISFFGNINFIYYGVYFCGSFLFRFIGFLCYYFCEVFFVFGEFFIISFNNGKVGFY